MLQHDNNTYSKENIKKGVHPIFVPKCPKYNCNINKTNPMEKITFEQMPAILGQLLETIQRLEHKIERIEHFTCNAPLTPEPLPKYVDIHGASEILSKSPNAIRVQMSLGKLKGIKKGSRNYFDRDYLEKWLAGETDI